MSPTAGSTAAFELAGDGCADGSDLLGVWRESPVPEGSGTAFGLADLPVWRADVPPSTPGALIRLTGSEAKVRASGQALAMASSRLDAALEDHDRGFAFAPSETPERGAPERGAPDTGLAMWLLEAGGGGGLAFDTTPGPAWWEAASRAAMRFSGQVARWCTPWSRVETLCAGHPAGLSLIGLGGNIHTVLGRSIPPHDAAVHQRVVALAVTSRATLFRVLAVVARAAATIGPRLALPGGPLLALPAVWRFVNAVIAEAAPPARG